MSNHIINPPFDIKADFWVSNLALSFVEPFSDVYEVLPKKKSSKFMWSIWLHEDPSIHNSLRRLPKDQKLDAIKKYYPSFNPKEELTKKCIDMYNHIVLTPAAKTFKQEEQSLVHRANLIVKVQEELNKQVEEDPLNLTDKDIQSLMAKIDKMRADTLKVYQQYEKVMKIFVDEQGEPVIYGGGKESLIESGGLLELDDDEEE